MNGNTVDLNTPILPTDKNMIRLTNFRAEFERFFIFIINYQRLQSLFSLKPSWSYMRFPVCTIVSVATKWPQPWPNPNKSRQQYAQDFYYLVDFMGMPGAMSPMLINPVLPDHIGGREIVYNNSPHPPQVFNTTPLMSRRGPYYSQARTMLPQPNRPLPPPVAPKKSNFKPWNAGRYHPYSKNGNK